MASTNRSKESSRPIPSAPSTESSTESRNFASRSRLPQSEPRENIAESEAPSTKTKDPFLAMTNTMYRKDEDMARKLQQEEVKDLQHYRPDLAQFLKTDIKRLTSVEDDRQFAEQVDRRINDETKDSNTTLNTKQKGHTQHTDTTVPHQITSKYDPQRQTKPDITNRAPSDSLQSRTVAGDYTDKSARQMSYLQNENSIGAKRKSKGSTGAAQTQMGISQSGIPENMLTSTQAAEVKDMLGIDNSAVLDSRNVIPGMENIASVSDVQLNSGRSGAGDAFLLNSDRRDRSMKEVEHTDDNIDKFRQRSMKDNDSGSMRSSQKSNASGYDNEATPKQNSGATGDTHKSDNGNKESSRNIGDDDSKKPIKQKMFPSNQGQEKRLTKTIAAIRYQDESDSGDTKAANARNPHKAPSSSDPSNISTTAQPNVDTENSHSIKNSDVMKSSHKATSGPSKMPKNVSTTFQTNKNSTKSNEEQNGSKHKKNETNLSKVSGRTETSTKFPIKSNVPSQLVSPRRVIRANDVPHQEKPITEHPEEETNKNNNAGDKDNNAAARGDNRDNTIRSDEVIVGDNSDNPEGGVADVNPNDGGGDTPNQGQRQRQRCSHHHHHHSRRGHVHVMVPAQRSDGRRQMVHMVMPVGHRHSRTPAQARDRENSRPTEAGDVERADRTSPVEQATPRPGEEAGARPRQTPGPQGNRVQLHHHHHHHPPPQGARPMRFRLFFRRRVPGDQYEELMSLGERLGDAAGAGLSEAEINRLPVIQYHMNPNATVSLENKCQICMGMFQEEEELRILPCLHRFHSDCIDEWIKKKAVCPSCRCQIREYLKEDAPQPPSS